MLNIIGRFLEKIFQPYFDKEYNSEFVTWVSWFNSIVVICMSAGLIISLLLEYFKNRNDNNE